MAQDRLSHLQTSHTQQAFLQSLEHPDMFSRHRQIDQPATGTFEWIFMENSSQIDEEPKASDLQGRFSKWLRSPEPVFWVNGKAGSGKSSLMSFIESHERTHDLLKIWAGGRRLHVFSFFFWRAGSEMQKSIAGVLQSLLYQLARAKPEIIGNLISSEISTLGSTWNQARLQRAIEMALLHYSEDRIFILIDGLDEFEDKYTALVTLLLGLQSGSHSKFCISSRPETALTRQLGTFPSLRLQDLNYDDIESFVYGELKPCEGVFDISEASHNLNETVQKIAHRAEGIFLWAVLVCKSLVSGYDSKDDARMLQRRLKALPSGIEALFAFMFSNIDKEHRQSLTKCFFLLKWSAENQRPVVSDVSLPVITAFLCASPHLSLSDFVGDCHVVEHRVIAQGKGLLETYQPNYHMFGTYDEDPQDLQFGPDILSDPLSGDDGTDGYRSISHEAYLTNVYKTTCVGWVHRSAYDYIFGDNSEHTRSWRGSMDEEKLLRRLLEAQSWLAHYFPGQHADAYIAPVSRIGCVIYGRTGEIQTAGFQALDKLYDTIEAAYYGGGCNDLHRSREIDSKLYRIFEEAAPLLAFWKGLAHQSQGKYLVTRFHKIRSSAYADILCSDLLNRYWYLYKPNLPDDKCMMPAMTLSLDHLFDQGSMGDAVVAACTPGLGVLENQNVLCYSWRGRERPKERTMVRDVCYALKEVSELRISRPDHVAKRHPETGYFLSEQDFALKLVELADIWQIYYGRDLDACGTSPLTPLQIHVSAPVYDWRGYKYSDTTLGSVLPGWRFVCFGHSEDLARRWSPNEHKPVVACFDIKTPKIEQLMNRFWRVRRDGNMRRLIFTEGTSEDEALCLGTILEEVWADADGQFDDGWQQLYMLACLRKYFSTLWEVQILQKRKTHSQDEEEA